MNNRKRNLVEIGNALGRIIFGMIIVITGLIAMDFIVYLVTIDDSYQNVIASAYDDGFATGYDQTYHTAYRTDYTGAYEQGYAKGYEIGQTSSSESNIPSLVALKNPTYQELKAFLSRDQTDANQYIPDKYISFDFAVELNNNAERQGIRAAYVTVVFPEKSHGITAFETSDRGLIFIEPQSDARVNLVIGESYWRLAGITDPADYDDTIVDIQLIW